MPTFYQQSKRATDLQNIRPKIALAKQSVASKTTDVESASITSIIHQRLFAADYSQHQHSKLAITMRQADTPPFA
jgi:hypothetical protein